MLIGYEDEAFDFTMNNFKYVDRFLEFIINLFYNDEIIINDINSKINDKIIKKDIGTQTIDYCKDIKKSKSEIIFANWEVI